MGQQQASGRLQTFKHAEKQYCMHTQLCVCRVIYTYTTTPLLSVIMALKCNSSDAGNASKPKRSHDVLSISEKVKILDMMETEKKLYAEIAGCMARTKLPFVN